MFTIVTRKASYELSLCHLQMNITSRCNMRCVHCWGDYSGALDLPLSTIASILDFAEPHLLDSSGFLISGGEPLLHTHFREIITEVAERKKKFLSLTTNGTFFDKNTLSFLENVGLEDLRVSVSLDSLNPTECASFRNCNTAYRDAVRAIELISKSSSIKGLVRATVKPSQIADLPKMIRGVRDLGADIFLYQVLSLREGPNRTWLFVVTSLKRRKS